MIMKFELKSLIVCYFFRIRTLFIIFHKCKQVTIKLLYCMSVLFIPRSIYLSWS